LPAVAKVLGGSTRDERDRPKSAFLAASERLRAHSAARALGCARTGPAAPAGAVAAWWRRGGGVVGQTALARGVQSQGSMLSLTQQHHADDETAAHGWARAVRPASAR